MAKEIVLSTKAHERRDILYACTIMYNGKGCHKSAPRYIEA